MKNSILLLGIVAGMLFMGCSTENQSLSDETETIQGDLLLENSDSFLSVKEINLLIDQSFYEKGSFSWSDVPANVLWSAAVHGDKMITIGYGNKNESFREGKNRRLENLQSTLITRVQMTEGAKRSQMKYKADETLNVIDIELTKLESVRALMASEGIRYLEPNGYSFYELKGAKGPAPQTRDAGCSQDGDVLNTNDYSTTTPNALVSWTFDNHNIPAAWNEATGAGVTIGIIDTGISPNQSLLNSNFTDGASTNTRTVEKYGTYIDSFWWWSNNLDGPNDRCGHGTSMAGTAVGPRNDDGLPTGVAYDANLISYRGTADVVLEDYHERKGVSDALRQLADRSDVDIISMSIGYVWSIGNVRDAIRYAHSKGKLIFAAGGTSTTFTNWYPVIFPANMDEAVAVTGVTDWSGGYRQCDVCHDGSQIEFTVIMERDNDGDRTGTTIGFNQGQSQYVGGSSVATATIAGVAALVWSKYPNWTREQVLDRMRQSSELSSNPSSNHGYGNIDALAAVQ